MSLRADAASLVEGRDQDLAGEDRTLLASLHAANRETTLLVGDDVHQRCLWTIGPRLGLLSVRPGQREALASVAIETVGDRPQGLHAHHDELAVGDFGDRPRS